MRNFFQKKIIVAVVFGALFLSPGLAFSTEYNLCCICTTEWMTGGMAPSYHKSSSASTTVSDSATCSAMDGINTTCLVSKNESCGEVAPPKTTTLTEEFNFKDVVLGITIPSLHFSPPPAEVDEDGNIYFPWIGEYIKAVYNFAVIVISILAVVMLIVAGAQVIMSAGGPAKATAYKRITQAVIGLFIAWGSYVILYTINPNLTLFKSLQVKFIEPISFAEEATPDVDVANAGLSGKVIKKADKSGRKDCLAELPADTVGIKLKDYGLQGVSPAGKHGAYYVTVNTLMIDDLKAVFADIAKTDYKIKAAGGVRGSGACTPGNLHLCGLAVDINPGDNPDCPAYTKQGEGKPNRKVGQYWDVAGDHKLTQDEFDKCARGEKITDIPQAVVDSFEQHGFYWGGYGWNEGRSDAMHFEYHRYCFN